MTVVIQQEIEVEVSELKKSCSLEELGRIFSEIANHIEEQRDKSYKERRYLVRQINDALSENAKRMLAEVIAYEFSKSSLPTE